MHELFYQMSYDGTYSVTGYEGDEAEVIIPDRYANAPVTVLSEGSSRAIRRSRRCGSRIR